LTPRSKPFRASSEKLRILGILRSSISVYEVH
jgi:hypothetical protein